ncbi:2978_t:CDS:2, partial [Gigaspora rosea]
NKDTTLGTIAGIRNWHEWSWPDNETDEGTFIQEPSITTHSHPSKSWNMPMPKTQGYEIYGLDLACRN